MESPRIVSVLGTGDFGCAVAKRLIDNGYDVVIGSRHPERRNLSQRDESLARARVTPIGEAIDASGLIIVAVNYAHVGMLTPYEAQLRGKILVDVSNPYKRSKDVSNAEKLAEMLPGAIVVKCFNTVSAYAMNSDESNEHMQVFIAGDDSRAVEVVSHMSQDMGFAVHNAGRLQKSRELEAQPLYLFKGWGWPTLFTGGLFIMELLYLFLVMYILVDRYEISQIPTYVLYKASGAVSVNLLAFCYLPGILAAFAQIFYGTKHKRFQVWLDLWLKGRKQLGIYSLLFAFIHMITVMSCMNGDYFAYLFKKQYVVVKAHVNDNNEVVLNSTTTTRVDVKMNLHGEGCIATGIIALCAMGIIGLSSIPPVGSLMNWREWRFVQSQFGIVCFLLTMLHCMVHGVPRWMIQRDLPLRNSFMSMILPWLTLLLKIVYFIPCVHSYVWKIRSGYERGVSYDTEKAASIPPAKGDVSYANMAYVEEPNEQLPVKRDEQQQLEDDSHPSTSSSSSSSSSPDRQRGSTKSLTVSDGSRAETASLKTGEQSQEGQGQNTTHL